MRATTTKPYNIEKKLVYDAYKAVKANAGAAGVDKQTIEQFDDDLMRNLYKIWNRMSSGSYFPPPVRAVSIPKKSGGQRILGVPTVADRIAQMVVKQDVERILEPIFMSDSYGYRPDKSALEAIGVTRKRCWQYDWVLEFDIRGLFDNIDHTLLLRAVRKHVKCKWSLLYIERWLKAPMELEDGTRVERTRGTPQGGVVTPRTQKITSAVLAIWLAGIRGWAAFGRSVGEGNRMADHDLIITHKDLFNQQAHDLLAIEDVESMQRSAEPAEECGECFGETEIGSAVGCLIGDRLQLAARGLFTLA